MADDTAALMDHIGVEGAHILGYSMGGHIAQELALRHPIKIRGLILAGTSARFSPIGKARAELLIRMVREGVAFELALRSFFLWLFSDRFFENEDQVTGAINSFMSNPYHQPIDGLEGQIAALLNHDTRGRLAKIASQTLIIGGAGDIAMPPKLSKQLAEGIKDSKLVLVEGGAHSFPFEMAVEFNKAVLEFLDGVL